MKFHFQIAEVLLCGAAVFAKSARPARRGGELKLFGQGLLSLFPIVCCCLSLPSAVVGFLYSPGFE